MICILQYYISLNSASGYDFTWQGGIKIAEKLPEELDIPREVGFIF